LTEKKQRTSRGAGRDFSHAGFFLRKINTIHAVLLYRKTCTPDLRCGALSRPFAARPTPRSKNVNSLYNLLQHFSFKIALNVKYLVKAFMCAPVEISAGVNFISIKSIKKI